MRDTPARVRNGGGHRTWNIEHGTPNESGVRRRVRSSIPGFSRLRNYFQFPDSRQPGAGGDAVDLQPVLGECFDRGVAQFEVADRFNRLRRQFRSFLGNLFGVSGEGLLKLFRYLPRNTSMATASWYWLMAILSGSNAGYTSISFTIQSASVAVVDANKCATTFPVTVKSSFKESMVKLKTSGRVFTKR